MDWDLLRTFAAVARLGSLTAAAKALGTSQSTVSRQLSKLEEDAGSPLVLRETPVRLTERGEVLLAAVRPMADAALAARAALEDQPRLEGEVTLTTVGEILRWVLVGKLPAFYRAYPSLRLRILADNRISSLADGEADVALRMARPERGELVASRLHTERYGFFVSTALALEAQTPWLGLTGSLAHIPEQLHADRAPRLLVEDVESLALAVAAGLGAAILPRRLATSLTAVVEVEPSRIGARDLGPIPSRDFWMVVHRSKQRVPKVRAVLQWLHGIDAFQVEAIP